MKMKNLDPYSGLRQVTSGYIPIPRYYFTKLVASGKLKASQLGYLLILIVSTDWDPNKYRFGYIRHTQNQLAQMWSVSESTLSRHIKKFIAVGILEVEHDTLRVANYKYHFTLKSAQRKAKDRVSDEKLKELFPKLTSSLSNSKVPLTENTDSFNTSFNDNQSVDPDDIPF